jgi:CcmD family protein
MTAVTYGLIAAWAILVGYVLTLVNREKQLKREITDIRAMLESGQASSAALPAPRD